MALEIVDLPSKKGGSFHSYVSLPEDNSIYCNDFHFKRPPIVGQSLSEKTALDVKGAQRYDGWATGLAGSHEKLHDGHLRKPSNYTAWW